MTGQFGQRAMPAMPDSRFQKWGRRVAIGLLCVYASLLPWEMYRRIWQVLRADLVVSSTALRPGATVSIDVVTSGEVQNRIVLELIQDGARHALTEFHGEVNRMNMWDIRTYRYRPTITLTADVLARFNPGPAVVRLTGYGGTKLLRTPAPVVREQRVMLAGTDAASIARAQSVAPPKRAHHELVYDRQRQQVLLAGGNTPTADGKSSTSFNDLWAFDGTRWEALASSGLEVWGMRLAFDSRRGRVVSFGGISNRRPISDVRVLENDAWIALGQHRDMPAAEAGFVYDSRRDRFVAFGGTLGDGSAYGDTWEFAGGVWTKVATPGPPARQAHAMVFDEGRGRTVIFGGTGPYKDDERPPRLGDVWEFDGRRWSATKFADGPGPRTSPGATYDSKRRVTIIFGGVDSTGFLGDLWAWNGVQWRKLADASSAGPVPRAMGQLAYDQRRDRVVLFGGRKGWPDGDLNDTWEWDGATWRQVRQ